MHLKRDGREEKDRMIKITVFCDKCSRECSIGYTEVQVTKTSEVEGAVPETTSYHHYCSECADKIITYKGK